MVTKKVVVSSEITSHVPPPVTLVHLIKNYHGTIKIIHGSIIANAKDMIHRLTLKATKGAALTIECEDTHQEKAGNHLRFFGDHQGVSL